METCREQQRLIKEASDALVDAIEEEAVYAAAEKAMMARRKSLENLAMLYQVNYYSEPRQPNQSRRLENAKHIGGDLRDYLNRGRRGEE